MHSPGIKGNLPSIRHLIVLMFCITGSPWQLVIGCCCWWWWWR